MEFVKHNGEATRFCKKCGVEKNDENFRKRKGGFVFTSCRDCVNVVYSRDQAVAHLNAIRCRCRKKGVPFNLTIDDLSIPEMCPILGIKLKSQWGGGRRVSAFDSPSLDKLIPSLGYVKGNVNVISHRANLIKSNATLLDIERLYAWMLSIHAAC